MFGMSGEEMQGTGSILTALATIYGIKENQDHNDEMLDFEKDRVSQNRKIDEERQEAYEEVWVDDESI